MRIPTLNLLKSVRCQLLRSPSIIPSRGNKILSTPQDFRLEPSSDCVSISPSWPAQEAPAERASVSRDMLVVRDFVSVAEEQALHDELEPYLRKMRYEYDHWDDAIHGFRETERSSWSEGNSRVLERVVRAAFPPGADALRHTHVLDLAPTGLIKPHVDAVRFCGRVIAGLCLLSDAVMKLVHTRHKHRTVHVLLPRRALYIMKDTARYDYTHEVLPQEESAFNNERVKRTRRISVICRSTPEPSRQPAE